jgi:UDP-N-acetyl-D-mannosaminuronic acid dehydrogenase
MTSGTDVAGSVAVVGLGYIGLPTAVALAGAGVRVVGVDVNPEVVAAVGSGRAHIVEPDLDEALAAAVASGLLTASTEMPAVDTYLVAVPTPFRDDRTADLAYVESATRSIARRLSGGELVVLESTSPPGTTELMAGWIAEERPDLAAEDVLLAHCPERVLPGRVLIELRENDRVIGALTPEAAERTAAVYRTFCVGELLLTDACTAELTKLVENSFRDVNIAFANELSLVCDRLGVDVWELIRLANHHPRVNILSPGPGVGGHCIAVDPWFIVAAAPEQSRLIATARQVNDSKPQHVLDDVLEQCRERPGQPVALLGLAFKKNIDDLRESPALLIVERLADLLPDVQLLVVEPHIDQLPPALTGRPGVKLTDLETAVSSSGTIVLLVDHDDFADVSPALLSTRAVIDTRGLWSERLRQG